MDELSREGGWGAGRARQSNWGGEPVRHWPPESVAKEGLAGGDGAVIGASESSDWRLGSPAGVDVPASHGRPGWQVWSMIERYDMVRCDGEDRRTAIQPSRTPWAGAVGHCHRSRLFFYFSKELTHLCCSLDPPPPTLNPQDERNGATQLMSGPLNPGTSSSPSSSESRICCTRNHYTTCLRNRLEGEAEGTDGVNILKEQNHSTHPPP